MSALFQVFLNSVLSKPVQLKRAVHKPTLVNSPKYNQLYLEPKNKEIVLLCQ